MIFDPRTVTEPGALVVQGSALTLPLPDASVDLIVTSPPYFALRSYRDGDEHYDGQIGSEDTPAAFLEALWAATAEMVRVLKPSGSIWVNLGDKYAGSGGHNNSNIGADSERAPSRYNQNSGGIPAKSLMGLPWRYANGCVDQLGLILRAEVVWEKGNSLPESVQDRVRRNHETWFHMTKSPRYFSAIDELRAPRESSAENLPFCSLCHRPANPLTAGGVSGTHESDGSVKPVDMTNKVGTEQVVQHQRTRGADEDHRLWLGGSVVPLFVEGNTAVTQDAANLLKDEGTAVENGRAEVRGLCAPVAQGNRPLTVDDSGEPSQVCSCVHPLIISQPGSLGKLPGSVWKINSEPLIVPDAVKTHYNLPDHFAAFPQEWPRRIILGWSPSGICCACGEGRRPVVEKMLNVTGGWSLDNDRYVGEKDAHQHNWKGAKNTNGSTEATITGYACACPDPTAPTRPAVVLDPFGGTGTVAMVARALGRYGVSVDLSHDYCRLAQWRIFESGHHSKAEGRMWAERQQGLGL